MCNFKFDNYRCPRPIWKGGETDEEFCIFHSDSKQKRFLFNAEIERVKAGDPSSLYACGVNKGLTEDDLDFTGFRFPDRFSFREYVFSKTPIFAAAVFGDHTDFRCTILKKGARFFRSTIGNESRFDKAMFELNIEFRNTTFKDHISFQNSRFGSSVIFKNVTIGDYANFRGSNFDNGAKFYDSQFGEGAEFGGSKFSDRTEFINTTFGDGCQFGHSVFNNGATFKDTTFEDEAYFSNAQFGGEVKFKSTFGDRTAFDNSTFGDRAAFDNSIFGENTTFKNATFGGRATFNRSTFGENTTFNDSTFGKNASFESTSFKGDVGFCDAKYQLNVSFKDSNIAGTLSLDKCTIKGEVSLNSLSVAAINLDNACIDGLLKMEDTDIRGLFCWPASGDPTDMRWKRAESISDEIYSIFTPASLQDAQLIRVNLSTISFYGFNINRLRIYNPIFGQGEDANRATSSWWKKLISELPKISLAEEKRGRKEKTAGNAYKHFIEAETVYTQFKSYCEAQGQIGLSRRFRAAEMEAKRCGSGGPFEKVFYCLYRISNGYGLRWLRVFLLWLLILFGFAWIGYFEQETKTVEVNPVVTKIGQPPVTRETPRLHALGFWESLHHSWEVSKLIGGQHYLLYGWDNALKEGFQRILSPFLLFLLFQAIRNRTRG